MDEYYVEFLGELKDDLKAKKRFFKHYNKWCEIINERIPELNETFDKNWTGKPITDYAECEEYDYWMVLNYESILRKSNMHRDLFFDYEIGDELQLIMIGRYGDRKGKRLEFVLRKG